MADLWWRQRWMKAIFGSDLKPLERLVAAVYADHARDRRQTFVTLDRLMTCSGLSRDAANRARDGLETKGWLVALERKARRPVDFLLVIPESAASTGDGLVTSTPDGPPDQIGSTPPDIGSPSPDIGSTRGVLHQSSYPSSHHSSSSPAQQVAASLLGIDEEDEVMDYLDDFLQAKNVGKAKAWLEATHAAGDLERIFYAYVKEQKTPSWGVESQPEDDGLMDNPDYIEGFGNERRVRVDDFHRRKIKALGFHRDEVDDFHREAIQNYPNGKALTIWREALINATRDVEENPRCRECGCRLDEGHHGTCSQRQPDLCDSCNAGTTKTYVMGLRPCDECGHQRRIDKAS